MELQTNANNYVKALCKDMCGIKMAYISFLLSSRPRRTSKVPLKPKDKVAEYRGKHPKCKFCTHYRYKILDCGGELKECRLKDKLVSFPDITRPFCKWYKVRSIKKEGEEGI